MSLATTGNRLVTSWSSLVVKKVHSLNPDFFYANCTIDVLSVNHAMRCKSYTDAKRKTQLLNFPQLNHMGTAECIQSQ